MAKLTELISELVISDIDFLETGFPFKYKKASIRVTNSRENDLFFSKLL
tara:strand:- start:1631 stop:1777 length:147 start_codon:yes stop_codon:yes gene_type:complete